MRMVSCLADLDWNKSTQQFLRNLSSAASGSSGWGSGRSSRQDGGYGRQGYGGQSSYDRQTHNNQGVSWHTKADVHYLSQNFWTRKYLSFAVGIGARQYLIEAERTGHAQQPRPICSKSSYILLHHKFGLLPPDCSSFPDKTNSLQNHAYLSPVPSTKSSCSR